VAFHFRAARVGELIGRQLDQFSLPHVFHNRFSTRFERFPPGAPAARNRLSRIRWHRRP
jgi:hypothetical protein